MFVRVAWLLLYVCVAISIDAATLSGTFTPVLEGTTVDLTTAGMEWAQWGTEEGVNRKTGITPSIGDLMAIGFNSIESVSNYPVLFNWNDGEPLAVGSNVTTAYAVSGVDNGLQLSVPAGLVKRRLRIFAGCEAGQARLDAALSDNSAPAFSDASLNANNGVAGAVYDLNYTAASDGQALLISLTLIQEHPNSSANVQVAAAVLSSNVLPVVVITTPTNNAIFSAPANVSVAINANDPDGALSKIELYNGVTKLVDLTNAPYNVVLTNLIVGSYSLSARAFDNDGDQATSPSVNFTVISNAPPQITLLSPTNDANYATTDSVFLSATAQDDGPIARVEWYVDKTKVGETLVAPYQFSVSNLAVGFRTIKAVVVDQFQAQRSASATIAVNSGLGSLTYTYAVAPTSVNLSAEGLRDWAHWGLYDQNSFNHKAGVPSQIGNYIAIGNDPVWNYTDNWTLYSWNSGTPVASVTDTPNGIYITGRNNGFEVRTAADTTIKTLKLYVGAWQAHGLLRAYMSDFSGPINIDSSLDNTVNALGAVYTLRYQAGAPGQSLIARYTVLSTHDNYGNVTLQAATLVSDNNPPSVTWLSPTNDSVFLAPTNITLEADAFDSDGSVTRVEFFNDTTKIGEATTVPYRFTWTNVLAGTYSLSARAVDNKGATLSSTPVDVSLITGGGYLSGTFSTNAPNVNLTFEGRRDWAHWGYRTRNSFDHKRLINQTQEINNFVAIGEGDTDQYSDNVTGFTWSDGTGSGATANDTHTGVYRVGLSNGFELVLPADQTMRRLRFYAGASGARGRFEASLSDFSAARFLDKSIVKGSIGGQGAVGTYTLFYAAASPGQTLRLRYLPDILFDQVYGNITFQAASMAIVPPSPILRMSKIQNDPALVVPTEPSFAYSVYFADALPAAPWLPVTNFTANALETTITNLSISAPKGFYRVKVQ